MNASYQIWSLDSGLVLPVALLAYLIDNARGPLLALILWLGTPPEELL